METLSLIHIYAVLPVTLLYGEAERALLLKILQTGDNFKRALDEKAPNYLCENAFELASLFSGFYHECRIIDEQDKEKKNSWLAITLLTRDVYKRQTFC